MSPLLTSAISPGRVGPAVGDSIVAPKNVIGPPSSMIEPAPLVESVASLATMEPVSGTAATPRIGTSAIALPTPATRSRPSGADRSTDSSWTAPRHDVQ
jgi:hypothetical protein